MTLDLIRAEEAETELRTILHPYDFYDLAIEFEDRGVSIKWERVLALETCGEVLELLGEVVA